MSSLGRDGGGRSGLRASFAGAVLTTMGMVAMGSAVMAQDPSTPAETSEPIAGTPVWSPVPPDASRVIVRDTFDAPGAWWTGADEVATSGISDGSMRWTIAQDRQSIWDALDLPTPLEDTRVDARVLIEQGVGAGGPMCAGTDEGERAIWAGVNGDDEWLVGRIAGSRVQVIERGDLAGVLDEDAWIGAPVPLRVTLECTVDPLGADHATVWIDGVQVADVTDEPVGPFLRAGLIASADQAGLSVLFDDFAVFGGPEALGSPVPSAPAG